MSHQALLVRFHREALGPLGRRTYMCVRARVCVWGREESIFSVASPGEWF